MQNKILRKELVVGIIVLFVGISVIPSNANVLNVNISTDDEVFSIPIDSRGIIYVDDDNTEGPWDGTIENPYQYIQDGVDNSIWGDTVYVFNGTYYERVKVRESIKLFGENKNSTIIDGGGIGSVITVTAHGVHVTGFTIQNSGGSYEYGGIYSISNYNKYYDNNIINNKGYGICLNQKGDNFDEEESNHNSIYLNTIKNNRWEGIEILGDYTTWFVKFRYNKIYNNIVSNNGGGISVGAIGCCNNEVYNNQINNNDRFGIFVWGFFNSITKNNIKNHEYGIDLFQGYGTLIKKNNFIDNDINAYFEDSFATRWVRNYWDDWFGLGPYAINGVFVIPNPDPNNPSEVKYLKNYDWDPARKPNDISPNIIILNTSIKNSYQSFNTLFLRFLQNHPKLTIEFSWVRNKLITNTLFLRFLDSFPILREVISRLINP